MIQITDGVYLWPKYCNNIQQIELPPWRILKNKKLDIIDFNSYISLLLL
jgi:hypothetical protein